MSDSESTVHPKPLILLASSESEQLHDVETALFSVGYRVVIARSERETIQRAREHQPDAIVLDGELASPEHSLCTALRMDHVSPATPILLTRTGPLTRTDRLATFGEGAWEMQSDLDMEELLVRLAVYLQAKLEVDRLDAECLIDRGSGLYNSHGFAQRTEELGALTVRQGLAAACAVFRPARELSDDGATANRIARAFKSAGRMSDALGRTDETEFAVFAPATNAWGAARLVHRMSDGVQRGAEITLRSAYSTALPSQKVAPAILLERARAALETRQN